MIELNPQYERIFDVRNIDDDCSKITDLMSSEVALIREAMDASLFKQAVTMYLQLLKAMYILQGLFEKLQMCNLDFETAMILKEGHDEIMQTECYQEYGYPSYI